MRSTSRTTRRLIGALAAAALGAGALAGCSSDDSSGGTDADGNITLKVGLFGTFGYKEAGLYDEYMKANPKIKIVENSIQDEQKYYQALQTQLAASSGTADIQGIEVARIAEVVKDQSAKFVDLSTFGAGELESDFFDWKWKAGTTKDGQVVGLGTDTGPLAICYRSDLFKAAGLPTDRDELATMWSDWDGFIATGEKYKAAVGGKSAFTDSASGLYNAIVGQSADQYYDASGTPIYDSNPIVKDAWDIAAKASTSGLTAKLKQFDKPWDAGFSAGSFATIACPAWMIGYIKGKAGDAGSGKWDVATIPGGSGNWGGAYLGVPKASKHAEEAYKLAKWLTAPEQQVKMWTKGQHFPSSATAAQDPTVATATDPYFGEAPLGKLFSDSASKLTVQVLGPKDGVIKDQFSNALVSVEQQGKSPDAAWETALKSIKDAITG